MTDVMAQDSAPVSVPIPSNGLVAEGLHDWAKAISIYLDEILKNPNRVDLWLRIAMIEHRLQNQTLTIDAYQHAISIQPNNPELHKSLSEVYSESNQAKNAFFEIKQAVRLKPNDVEYLRAQAQIANWNKQSAEALQSYQTVLVLSKNIKPEDQYSLLTEIVRLQLELHQLKDAKETYQKILTLAPNNKDIQAKLSQLEKYNTHPVAVKIEPILSPTEQALQDANEAASHHQYWTAAKALKRAISLNPKNANFYKKLADTYSLAQQPQLALNAINQAVMLSPNDIYFLRQRGILASWAGNKGIAEESYQRILRLNPMDEDALLNLAHLFAWQSKIDVAMKAYQELLRLFPKNAEGWIQYADVLSWVQNYIGALSALNHYRDLEGKTSRYVKEKAKILSWSGLYQSAFVEIQPLLPNMSNDIDVLTTEVIASVKAKQTNQALCYLKKLNQIHSNDNQIKSLNKIVLKPLKSKFNLGGEYLAATDTTRILDIPVGGQYFITPTTSLLLMGLYERATAKPHSGLETYYGKPSIFDESAAAGFTTQFRGINLLATAGAVKIQNENNHGTYDLSLNTNLTQRAQVTFESLQNLFRPYLVPQSPRSISLQIMENRNGFLLEWQPVLQKYLNVVTTFSTLSDNNNYWHVNIWPKARVYGSQHWLVTLGVDGDFWSFARRAMDGYYSPLLFQGYEGTIELYYAQSENIGYSLAAGFGMQKDEKFPHFFYEEDISAQLFYGIFKNVELRIRGGYTLRKNPSIISYQCWSTGVTLAQRF